MSDDLFKCLVVGLLMAVAFNAGFIAKAIRNQTDVNLCIAALEYKITPKTCEDIFND